MGYTHYWRREKDCPAKAWQRACRDVRKILKYCAEQGIRITEEFDLVKRPVVTVDEIRFNGYEGGGYETFRIPRCGKIDDFCKTGRQPYDLAVMLCLLCIAHHDDNFHFSSDGSWNDEWKDAVHVFTVMFGGPKQSGVN